MKIVRYTLHKCKKVIFLQILISNLDSNEGTSGMDHNKCCTNNCLLSHDIELEPAAIIWGPVQASVLRKETFINDLDLCVRITEDKDISVS